MKGKIIRKQILILFTLSVLLAVAGIIHGIFFDLDISQIKRLTATGLIFTVIVVFPMLILLERIFDINNKKRFRKLEKRIRKLEGKNGK